MSFRTVTGLVFLLMALLTPSAYSYDPAPSNVPSVKRFVLAEQVDQAMVVEQATTPKPITIITDTLAFEGQILSENDDGMGYFHVDVSVPYMSRHVASFVTVGPMAGDRRLIPPDLDSVRPEVKEPATALHKIATIADDFVAMHGRAPASVFEIIGYAKAKGMSVPAFTWGDNNEIKYLPSLNHRSFTVAALDDKGRLLLTLHTGGINFGFEDYGLLRNLDKGRDPIAWAPENLLWTPPWESNPLGHLVADAMKEVSGADIAVMNAYGLRGHIPAGPIYESDIWRVLPFRNRIVTINLTGRDLIKVIQRGVEGRWFLYSSGIAVSHNFQLGIPRMNVRLMSGEAIVPDKNYRIAVPEYIASGGDGHFILAETEDADEMDLVVADAVIMYLKNHLDWRPDAAARVYVE